MRKEGEVVLVYYQEKPVFFGRIESIEPDIKRGWYHLTLLMLTIPTQTLTWILKEAYIDGEPFTMGGMPMRLETVGSSTDKKIPNANGDTMAKETPGDSARIIPFKKPET